MPVFYIQARYTSARSELAEATPYDAALAIESAVSVALLELCGVVEIEHVQVVEEPDAVSARAEANRPDAVRRRSTLAW